MLAGKRVILTGATGFLGQHILRLLKREEDGPSEIFPVDHRQFDLTQEAEVQRMYENAAAGSNTVVIHCAADCGGIGLNNQQPGRLFYSNIMMNTLMMEYAMWNKVGKYVAVGSICSYPAIPNYIPFREADIWEGYPEASNAAYGMAKKMQLVQAEAYRKQYGFNVINLMLANLYGPGDNYDPASSHVIPALILKMLQAKNLNARSVTLWGTGTPTRDFLFAPDAASMVLQAADNYEKPYAMNIGTGQETSIRDVAELIRQLVEYKGEILWDRSKPDGQARRVLDVSRMWAWLGPTKTNWLPTRLFDGLRMTVWDYQAHDEASNKPLHDQEEPAS